MRRAEEQMRHRGSIVAALIVVFVGLSACSRGSAPASTDTPPATVQLVPGTDLRRVILSPEAAKRLGLQTSTVRAQPAANGKRGRTVIPYAAVLYDANGRAWTFVQEQGLAFMRQRIRIDRIDDKEAILSSGPPPGSAVVTVGAAELLGAEFGVSED